MAATTNTDAVPLHDSVAAAYGAGSDLASDRAKAYAALVAKYEEAFGSEEGAVSKAPQFFVRAPGRVNLIGEHVDYMGYSVLPMAIACDIVMAVGFGPEDSKVCKIANTNARFETEEFSTDPSVALDRAVGIVLSLLDRWRSTSLFSFPSVGLPFYSPRSNPRRQGGHRWSHYFQCGYKGAFVTSDTMAKATSLKELNTFPEASKASAKPLRVVVTGFVPMGSGLSSSSAFVVGSCLSTATANGAVFTRTELAGGLEGFCGGEQEREKERKREKERERERERERKREKERERERKREKERERERKREKERFHRPTT